MKCVVLEEPGRFALREADAPQRAADEALVRVHQVGVCGTDLHAYRGKQPFFVYPRIVGHELGVEVVEVGPNEAGLQPGDRCVVEPYLHCGTCIACRRGKPNCCANLRVMGVHIDGGMRQYLNVPVHKLHRSRSLSFEQLALVETLGIGAHAVSRAEPEPGEWMLVIGAGPIGVSALQFVQESGARAILLDVDTRRLAFCRSQLGVEHTIEANDETLEQLLSLTEGDLPTAVIDATGNPHSMMRSFNYVAHGGRLVFVGLYPGEITFSDPDFHRRELTLRSSRNSASADFPRIIRLVEEGRIDTRPWITHRASCDSVVEEFPRWLEPDAGVLKAVVAF